MLVVIVLRTRKDGSLKQTAGGLYLSLTPDADIELLKYRKCLAFVSLEKIFSHNSQSLTSNISDTAFLNSDNLTVPMAFMCSCPISQSSIPAMLPL